MNGDVHKAGHISPGKSTVAKELSSGVLTEQSFFLKTPFKHFFSVIKTRCVGGCVCYKKCVRQVPSLKNLKNLKMKCLPEDAGSQLC